LGDKRSGAKFVTGLRSITERSKVISCPLLPSFLSAFVASHSSLPQATAELSPADIAAMSHILFAAAPVTADGAGMTADGNCQPPHVRAGTIEECHSAMRQLLSVIQALQQERDALRSAEGGADVCRLLELEKEVGVLHIIMLNFYFIVEMNTMTGDLAGEAAKD
jgi:hypothetical protein